jgi:cytochrome c oxidase subunit 1
MTVAVLCSATSTFLGALNIVVTLLRREPKEPLSLSAWGQLLAGILNLLFLPVLAAGSALLLSDRVAGTHFFTIEGDPILYQHLFWLFGHPEVYVLILPAWGLVADVLAEHAGRPPFWRRGTVGAMIAVTALSGLVYGHHMFLTGFGELPRIAFETLTLAIGLPSTIIFANWVLTLARGRVRWGVPLLYALGVVLVFGAGGLTGLLLGATASDVWLHDTLWVVGHFHLTMAAATFLAIFAAIRQQFPTLFPGRTLNPTLGGVHAVGSFVLFTLTFGGLLYAGWAGQLRRLYDPFQYGFLAYLADANRWTSWAAFALGAVQLVFVVDFTRALVRRA